jgi:hypothetical protein
MKPPKFWPDSGHWNDGLVSLCILISLGSGALVAWRFRSSPFLVAAGILLPLTGVIVGVTLVGVLCTWFSRRDG